MQKVLKIKVGEVYIEKDKKNYPVLATAWKKESKDGKISYFEVSQPIFVQEVSESIKEEKLKSGEL